MFFLNKIFNRNPDSLGYRQIPNALDRLPSPTDLRGKIIIKHEKISGPRPTDPIELQIKEEIENISYALSDLVFYCQKGDYAAEDTDPKKMCSFEESVFRKKIKSHLDCLIYSEVRVSFASLSFQ